MGIDYEAMRQPILAPKDETPAEAPAEEEQKPTQEAAPAQEETQEEKPAEEAPAEGEPQAEKTEEEAPPPEPTEIDVDGEKVDVEELKESYKVVVEARKKITEANERIAMTNNLVKNLLQRPADTLLMAFTDLYKGDKDKAYGQVVGLAEKIIAFDLKLQALPPGEKKALEKEREVAELRKKLKDKEEAEQRAKAEEEEKLYAEKFELDITNAIKAAKLEPSDKAVAAIAEIMLQAREIGVKATPEQAVARYLRMQKQKKGNTALTIDDIPPELIEKIRKGDLESAKAARRPQASKTSAPAPKQDSGERKVRIVNSADWESAFREKW